MESYYGQEARPRSAAEIIKNMFSPTTSKRPRSVSEESLVQAEPETSKSSNSEHPDAKFYKLDSFSEARFAPCTHRLLFAFLRYAPYIIMNFEKRALEGLKTAHDKKIMRRIKKASKKNSNVTLMGNLAGLCDIYNK
jgi:hypothetical protein